jgi:ABC-type nickel/cobalt efflux system permease component RcnA
MSVLTYSVGLLLTGVIIALSFNESVGIALSVAAVAGILYGLISFETDLSANIQQDDIDRHVDDVMQHRPRV